MKKRMINLITGSILMMCIVYPQDAGSDQQEVLESIMDRNSENENVLAAAEELELLRSDPVDVSRPLYSELIRLPMVSPMLAESIILLTDSVAVTQVEHIRSASLMTDKLFEQLRPFITVREKNDGGNMFGLIPHNVSSRSRTERRYSSSSESAQEKFLGSNYSSYTKMTFDSPNIQAAVLSEKDPGELMKHGFTTGGFMLKNGLNTIKLILGDFNVATDQGMLFARNSSSSKGNETVNQIRKRGRMLSVNTSADELRFFRGAALESTMDMVTLLAFYSQRTLPASQDEAGTISSLYSAGVFRNENELKKRNKLKEFTVGGRVELGIWNAMNISATFLSVRYYGALSRNIFPYMNGTTLTAGSFAFDLPTEYGLLFGEIAAKDPHRFSRTAGLIIPVSRTFSLSLHHRSFLPGFSTPFAHPFAERGSIEDGETGSYMGFAYNADRLTVRAYFDRSSYPAVGTEFSSGGTGTYISAEYPLTGKMFLYLHVKNTIRIRSGIHRSDDERRQTNIRVEGRVTLSRGFIVTSRFESTDITYAPSGETERGILLFADASYRESKLGFRIKSRFIFFDSPSYDSRLYQFESDVAGNYSNPPLYGKGFRWYMVAGYELFDDLHCSLKYAETVKLPFDLRWSMEDRMPVLKDSQAALQLDFQF